MVILKDPSPPPYVPRLDYDGKVETAVSLLGKTVKFEQQTGDDEGLVREFNPKTGMCKVQLFSGKVVSIIRTEFETVENLIRKREKRARDAISEKYALIDGEGGEAGSINGFDANTLSSFQGSSVQKRNLSDHGTEDESDEASDEDEEEIKELTDIGKSYLEGDDRYLTIASKYDQFRGLLAAARVDRENRRPGKSALDDLESIASDDKSFMGESQGAESPMPQVLGRSGVAKNDDGSITTVSHSTSKSVWSFGSIKHYLVQESTDLLLTTKYKMKKPPVNDHQSKAQQALYNKFQGYGKETVPSPTGGDGSLVKKTDTQVVPSGGGGGGIFPGEDEEPFIVQQAAYVSPVQNHRATTSNSEDLVHDTRGVQASRRENQTTQPQNIGNGARSSLVSPEGVTHHSGGSVGFNLDTQVIEDERGTSSSSMGNAGFEGGNDGGGGGGVGIGRVSSVPISDWGGDVSPTRQSTSGDPNKMFDNLSETQRDDDMEKNANGEEGQAEEDEEEYDYVFPIIIERIKEGAPVVTRWAPGSNVEIALNKGDNLKYIAMQFVIKYDLPGAVADSVLEFLEKTISKDPSSAFTRKIVEKKSSAQVELANTKEEKDIVAIAEENTPLVEGTTKDSKAGKLTGAELDRIEAKEAARLEEEARRPHRLGGTPYEHYKRHPVHGSTRPLNYDMSKDPSENGSGFRGGSGGDEQFLKEDAEAKKKKDKGEGGVGGVGVGNIKMNMSVVKNQTSSQNDSNSTQVNEMSTEETEEEKAAALRKRNQFAPTTAFMVLAVLRKGRKDSDRVALSLKTVLTDISTTSEGCALLVKHKVLELVIDIADLHWMDVKIQVLACLVLRNLVFGHIPLRRNEMLLTSLRAHLKRLLKIKQVVESSIDAFRIMATESCKIAAFEDTIVKDLSIFDFILALASSMERASNPDIVYPALRFMSLVVGLRQRPACKQLVLGNGVYFALSCLQVHSNNPQLMTSALRLLVLAARIDGDVTTGGPSPNHGVADAVSKVRLPPQHKTSKSALLNFVKHSVDQLANQNGDEFMAQTDQPIPTLDIKDITDQDIKNDKDVELVHPVEVILHTMMRLHSDSKLQLGGTELIRTLIENEDARKVLDGIPGGLDWLCQGPDEGNVLIHWRDGALKNEGWAYGEQKFHTGTAAEYLWEGADGIANLNRPVAELRLSEAIAADAVGIPTKDSIHAHQELASMHHVVREYDKSEHHYDMALKKTDTMISEAKHEVFCQRSTIKAAKAAGVSVLPPIHVNHGGSGGGGGGSSQDVDSNGIHHVHERDSTVVGTLARKVYHFDDSEGGELSYKLIKAEKDLQAAKVRRDVIIANRNMMRRDHENGAEYSERLELWTPSTLKPFLMESEYHQPKISSPLSLSAPSSSVWSSAASSALDKSKHNNKKNNEDLENDYDAMIMKKHKLSNKQEDVPLKLPSISGKQPPQWDTFNDKTLKRHFNVYKRLALLPMYGETVQDWRKRIKFWEKESGTTVAMLSMVERNDEYPGIFPM